jgi:predicted AlkP superfamily pyrophosphatase or phosphodiesterase
MYHPQFMTAYFTALDHTQHTFGPDTPEAHAVLERIDTIVGNLIQAADKSDPKTVIAVVSDHGFAPLAHDVNLIEAFTQDGLIRFDNKGKVSSWDAEPWYSGGSAAIVLRDSHDTALHLRVKTLLDKLAKDERDGISRILSREEIGKREGNPQAEWYVLFKLGYQMAPEIKEPLLGPSKMHGMHGYDADLPEMRSTFLLLGKDVPAAKSFGSIDMRDIAPTLAHILGVPLPSAQGKSLLK